MPDPIVVTEQICRKFGQFVAVHDLNLQINKGEIFGFLGANGAGKTTTIRMLCGPLKPTAGKGLVAGYNILNQTEQLKRKIGYMSQRFALYDDLTIKESIEFYGGVYGLSGKAALERAEKVLYRFGIKINKDMLVKSLPVGFKQRLALTCSLLHDPTILFLDEPTSGVDPQARRQFWQVINSLTDEGKTVIVTTHFMDEAEYCHRLIIMNFGKVIAIGKPSDLKTIHNTQTIHQLFLKLVL